MSVSSQAAVQKFLLTPQTKLFNSGDTTKSSGTKTAYVLGAKALFTVAKNLGLIEEDLLRLKKLS